MTLKTQLIFVLQNRTAVFFLNYILKYYKNDFLKYVNEALDSCKMIENNLENYNCQHTDA